MTWNFQNFKLMSLTEKDASFDLSNVLQARYRYAGHILFWICLVMYEGLTWSIVDGAYTQRLTTSLIELPIKIAATYFTLYILIDKFLVNRRYGLFALLLFPSVFGFGTLLRITSYYITYPLFYPDGKNLPVLFFPKILIYTFAIYSLVAIVATLHLIRHWYRHQQSAQLLQQANEQLEKEKLAAELKLLKSQINPHFLFNTLNNLYALTLNNSDKSPEVVYKLSQLMSYMLYDSNQVEVPLEKEIQYIQNYIALEKIRYSNLDVSLNVFDDITDVHLAPLLILPFVENSFKHGVSNQLSRGWIRIDIQVQESTLVIKVENSKEAGKGNTKPLSGIGLQNVRKRLDLIYHNHHSLQIINEEELYLVILKIEYNKTKL